MAQKIPKIIIKYNRLIDPIFIFFCQNNPKLKKLGWNKWVPPSKEEIIKRVCSYNKEWSKYEKKILKGMCDILGLGFKTNIIDVHIVSGNPRSMSHPIIIKSCYPSDEFVDVLTHELIHRLLVLNAADKGIVRYKIKKKYISESRATRNHIIIHAVLKNIYIDILKQPHRLERDILKCRTKDYSRSWEIVEQDGYRQIISDFKKNYKR